jgi:pyruvate formate lyase activating enzyme
MYRADRCVRCGDCIPTCIRGALSWRGEPAHDTHLCRSCAGCAKVCPSGARELVGYSISVAELLQQIQRDVVFFDESGGGVSFSGGEPLLQADFLEAVLQACSEAGIHTVVDTCGYASAATFARIARKVDLFYYDLKVIDPVMHRKMTGVSNDLILANLCSAAEMHVPVVVRIPVIPNVNDDDVNLRATSELLSSLGLFRLDLLPFHRMGAEKYSRLGISNEAMQFEEPSPQKMDEIAERFRKHGFEVRVGG